MATLSVVGVVFFYYFFKMSVFELVCCVTDTTMKYQLKYRTTPIPGNPMLTTPSQYIMSVIQKQTNNLFVCLAGICLVFEKCYIVRF